MPDTARSRRQDLSDSSSGTRSISTSEAIRNRVNQILGAKGGTLDPLDPRLTVHSHETQAKADFSTPSSSSRTSQSLKRKKLARAENRSFESGTVLSTRSSVTPRCLITREPESSHYSHKKGRTLVPKHPQHHRHGTRESSDESLYSGPIAAAEFERMKQEIESLKEALHESKKSSKRQVKKLEEAKAELKTTVQSLHDKDSELRRIKEKRSKEEELLSTIEASAQCQICMDLPDQPFALAPCGHILCLLCLQEWFRKAPPSLEDMDIDPEELTDPEYVLMRSKSCPSCRTEVKHRPIPVFMVKAIVVAFRRAKSSSVVLLQSDSHVDAKDDPWEGIFPPSDDDELEGEDEEEDDVESSMGESGSEFDVQDELRSAIYWYRRRAFQRAHFRGRSSPDHSDLDLDEDADAASESDEDHLSNSVVYIRQRWAPPRVSIDPDDFDLSEEQDSATTLKLLQRGCSWEMIQSFDVAYYHSSGLILSLRSLDHLYSSDNESEDGGPDINGMNRIFLGWNIHLDEDDVDGESFINEVLEDIKNSPERWLLVQRSGMPGVMDVRRLVKADEVEDYDTTETDEWLDTDDF